MAQRKAALLLVAPMTPFDEHRPRVAAIVPARNEEAVITDCLLSLAQQGEIQQIIVVNDHSDDATAARVAQLMPAHPQIKLLDARPLPSGWIGKNNAVWCGAQVADADWLLFTDADAVHEPDSVAQALDIAKQQDAALVSFSPEQVMKTWYERSLIPQVYCSLSRNFLFDAVNDPLQPVAAANGQFLFIRRDAYHSAGGHAAVAGDLLEDVAIARCVKSAGYRIWFGSGNGIVRVRMYRTFAAMWEGWRKNLYRLVGGTPMAVALETTRALLPPVLIILGALLFAWKSDQWDPASYVGLVACLFFLIQEAWKYRRNGFQARLVAYAPVGILLYVVVLWASYRAHRNGSLQWKGRAYPVGRPPASN